MSDLVEGIAKALGEEFDDLEYGLTGGSTINVFEEQLPTEPDVAVGVYSAGGFEADSLMPFDTPSIQLIIRGDADPNTARAMWHRIYSFLHGKRNATLPDGTYLVSCLAVQSAPVRLGTDDNGRYRFSMNLRCEVQKASTHRPGY